MIYLHKENYIMTQLLQTAIEKALQLPESSQNELALAILNHIKKANKELRPLGFAAGMGSVSDDFNAPLSDEELSAWYDGHPKDPLKGDE